MKIISIRLLLATIIIFSALLVQAQDNGLLEVQKNEQGKIIFARVNPNGNNKIADGNSFLKKVLEAGPDDEFRMHKETTDELGIIHRRYYQYYKGVRVEGSEYLIHGKNGLIETMNGYFAIVHVPSATPSVTEAIALTKALSVVKAKEYKWEDSFSEETLKRTTGNPAATYYPKGSLVISKESETGTSNWRLVWSFTIPTKDPNDVRGVLIDATNGTIVNNKSLLQDANVPCNAQTTYSGAQAITGDTYPGGVRLREVRNAVNIATLNIHSGFNVANATDFANNSTNWTPGNWATIGQDQVALDIHWAEEAVLDFWRATFNRNSLDGNGLPITGYVHFFQANTTAGWPNNAVWDPNSRVMEYGDGDGFQFRPFGALDVIGHEMGHGVQQFTSNMATMNQNTEADALNEGLSDIWGICVENRTAPTKVLWRGAEDIVIAPGFNCIRDYQNPKSAAALEGSHPTTYLRAPWSTAGNSHVNSTVLTHWFFILCQGDHATNDNGNTYNVCGIGIPAAQAIVYRAESNYLHAGATYTSARNAMISASTDISGANSLQTINVINAWYAVGVGSAYTTPMTVTGPDFICPSGTYTLNNSPTSTGITWGTSNTTYSTIAPNNPPTTALLSKKGTPPASTATTVTASAGCNGVTASASKLVVIGAPMITGDYINAFDNAEHPLGYYPDITNPACTGYYITTEMGIYGATSVTWTKVSSTAVVNWTQTGNDIKFYLFGANQTVVFKITASNSCGSTSYQFAWKSSNCSGGGGGGCFSFQVSPNPAKGQINIVHPNIPPPCGIIGGSTTSKEDFTGISSVRVYDNSNRMRKNLSYRTKPSQVSIAIADLETGVYIVEIVTDRDIERQKIIVK